jgi:hypothetical protein
MGSVLRTRKETIPQSRDEIPERPNEELIEYDEYPIDGESAEYDMMENPIEYDEYYSIFHVDDDYDYELLDILPDDEEVNFYTKNLDYRTINQLMQIFYDRYFTHNNISLKDSFRCTYIYWRASMDLTIHYYPNLKKAYYNLYFNGKKSHDYT